MGNLLSLFNALIILLLSSLVFSNVVHVQVLHAMPPPNPIKCGSGNSCTVHNTYGVWGDRRECVASTIVYPTTEEELRLAVANATQNNLKVKVVTKFSGTIPKLVCPSSQQPPSKTMLISTEHYASGIEIDKEKLEVTVDSGVGLRDLINKIEEAGLSLISTGSQGSSWWGHGGAPHDHVLGLSLIIPETHLEGFAKVLMLEGNDPLLRAAKVSLGVLGVISKVRFRLEEAFKRSITLSFTGDEGIENEYIEHGKKYEFGDITWYPSAHTAVYRNDQRVPLSTSGDGVNDFLGFQSQSILVSTGTRAIEKHYENTRDVKGKCNMATLVIASKKLIANGLKNNGLLFTGYPVIGTQAKMQTSGSCLYSSPLRLDLTCAWDPRIHGLSFYESTAIFRASKFGDFIRDVKKLRDLITPQNLCEIDLYNGILMRFIKASDAYLGQEEDSVVIDFNYYRADDPKMPRLNQDVMEEIEQLAFFKHGARPHWAKNRVLAFLGVPQKYPQWGKFIEAKKKLDPQGMFSSEWSDEVLYGEVKEKGDGCALEGLCICSEDRHCSPSKGYFCKPGVVYQEARVCRFSPVEA